MIKKSSRATGSITVHNANLFSIGDWLNSSHDDGMMVVVGKTANTIEVRQAAWYDFVLHPMRWFRLRFVKVNLKPTRR